MSGATPVISTMAAAPSAAMTMARSPALRPRFHRISGALRQAKAPMVAVTAAADSQPSEAVPANCIEVMTARPRSGLRHYCAARFDASRQTSRRVVNAP